MSGESIQDTVNELRETTSLVRSITENKDHQIQKLELQVQALHAELESVHNYYSGINELLDRLSVVKGAVQQQRVAVQILDLRNRKSSLKKVERGES